MTSKRRWIAKTIPELAEALGVSERSISSYLARGAPRVRGGYSIPAFVTWLRENVWRPKALPMPPDDPLLEGPETPSLERLRSIRAEQEQIKLDIMRGESTPIEVTQTILNEVAGLIRDATATLEQKFGAEARNRFDSVLARLQQRIEQAWGSESAI